MNEYIPPNQCYKPEQWVMLKDDIYAAQHAIRIGLEYINDDVNHCENVRRTRQNLKYLEIVKNEKLILEKALEGLSKPYTGWYERRD